MATMAETAYMALGMAPVPNRTQGEPKTAMRCLECGARFKKQVGPRTFEVKCPKCGGYDTEVA